MNFAETPIQSIHCKNQVFKSGMTQVNPLEPLANLIKDFMARGGTIWACTPCVKSRGYGQEDLLEGVVISGASVVHERIKTGAATLSF